MSEWPRHSVTELERAGVLLVQDGNHGNDRPRPDEFVSEGVAFVRAADMSSGRVDFGSASRINEVARKRIRKGVGQRGDVLLSHKGTVGRVAAVPLDAPPFVCSPQTTFWRSLDESRLDRTFLRCFMSSPDFAAQLNSRKGETDMAPYVSLTEQRKLTVVLPPLAEQRAIAGVLGALDDKIESNRRLWKLRHELATTQYSEVEQHAREFSALGAIYEVGLSGVWGDGEMSSKFTIATQCLRGRDLEDYVAGQPNAAPVRFISAKQLANRQAGNGEIWTAGSGSLGPSLLITPEVLGRWSLPATYSNFVKRLIPRVDATRSAVAWQALRRAWMLGEFTNYRTGTAMPNLDADAMLRGVQVPCLDDDDAASVDEATRWALDPQLLDENDALASLRDALLPELLSGRLRVREAEEMVEDVV